MSREISIGYQLSQEGPQTDIEVPAPYFLLGTQRTSMRFWSLPQLREIGLTRLVELGVSDPVYFVGWEGLADLEREIDLLQKHVADIDCDTDTLASWLSHLVYCYALLVRTAPRDSTPILTIG